MVYSLQSLFSYVENRWASLDLWVRRGEWLSGPGLNIQEGIAQLLALLFIFLVKAQEPPSPQTTAIEQRRYFSMFSHSVF